MPNTPLYGFRDISDGTSHTLMIGEIRQGQHDEDLRGLTWWAPAAGFTAHYRPQHLHDGQHRLRLGHEVRRP